MKIDLNEMLRRAYFAGFAASSESYNGEYPFAGFVPNIERELSDHCAVAVEEIISSANVELESR